MSTDNKERVINSRTIRVNAGYDEALLSDYTVTATTSENGRTFIECTTVEDARNVFQVLSENELNPISISYSLFFKSDNKFESEEEATTAFQEICNCVVTYMRVNTDGHTGKLVVDTLDDYNTFKNYNVNSTELRFYHFNSNRNNTRTFRRTETDTRPAPRRNANTGRGANANTGRGAGAGRSSNRTRNGGRGVTRNDSKRVTRNVESDI